MGQSIGRLVADGLPREVATAMIGLLIGWYMSRPGMQARSPGTTLSLLAKRDSTKKNQDSSKAYFVIPTCFDIRRQAQLVFAKPTDHGGEVVVKTKPEFDLDQTIFQTLPRGAKGFFPRKIVAHRLGVDLFWDDAVAVKIQSAYASVPRAPKHDQCILDFMRDECNFNTEHADGSFLDHLQFCYEYSAAYFKEHSPRVLFLHSILGVGTNIFPMKIEDEPTLAKMLTPIELKHIRAFPAILRLLASYDLIDHLSPLDAPKLKSLESITFNRVIDNKPMTLSADEFWVQLNYQLIHLLDFLPVSNWLENADDLFLLQFRPLYEIMVRAGKLSARVDFDLSSPTSGSDNRPLSLASFVKMAVPSPILRRIAAKNVREYSDKVGHSLQYEIKWSS